jgi:hypothetical protein
MWLRFRYFGECNNYQIGRTVIFDVAGIRAILDDKWVDPATPGSTPYFHLSPFCTSHDEIIRTFITDGERYAYLNLGHGDS